MVRRIGFLSGWKKAEFKESMRWRVETVNPRKKGKDERLVIMYVRRTVERGRIERGAFR